MHSLGLEWLHRLLQEPHRLVRRYLVQGMPFAARLLLSSALARRRER
jgi:N-acetylglucosaminyldiphosphoundecaprenol N-acetyl-beta-D-mannosaminyltransferase